jgi:hypothetical protein
VPSQTQDDQKRWRTLFTNINIIEDFSTPPKNLYEINTTSLFPPAELSSQARQAETAKRKYRASGTVQNAHH